MTAPICSLIDGFAGVPGQADMVRRGFRVDGRGMTPSVTNVNNVSLVTASYPESHGITSNYWLDRQRGEEFYMESGEFLRAETMSGPPPPAAPPRMVCSATEPRSAYP